MRWYCGSKSIYLTKKYMELHHCRRMRKGVNKGRPCRFLIKQNDNTFKKERSGELVVSDENIDRFIESKRRG